MIRRIGYIAPWNPADELCRGLMIGASNFAGLRSVTVLWHLMGFELQTPIYLKKLESLLKIWERGPDEPLRLGNHLESVIFTISIKNAQRINGAFQTTYTEESRELKLKGSTGGMAATTRMV